MDLTANDSNVLRDEARKMAVAGQGDQAEIAYRALLDDPVHAGEALNYVAMFAVARGRPADALELLTRARALHPGDLPTLKNLGVLHLQRGAFDEAIDVLSRARDLDPDFFVAQLYLGAAYRAAGQHDVAVAHGLAAIGKAQSLGHWISDATTPAGLRDLVKQSMLFVRQGRERLLGQTLAPLFERFGRESMSRVARCVANWLGQLSLAPPDSRQKPTFLYFPDLPSTPYLSRDLFPWQDALEANATMIADEVMSVLQDNNASLEPFLGEPPPGMTSSYLGGGLDIKPKWDAFFFYRHGNRFDANCTQCPRTAALLDAVPLARIPDHAPECLVSVLGPGSHILPHHGVTNTRIVTHLPLFVPSDCALRVAGEDHHWQEGRCVSFDDTFVHEAWNRSDRNRLVILMDTWNPHMTAAEIEAVHDIVLAIADISRFS